MSADKCRKCKHASLPCNEFPCSVCDQCLNGTRDMFISRDESKASESPDQTIKADAGKPQLRLVPPEIIRDIAYARAYGIKKYGDPESWRKVDPERYIDAAYRHLLAFVENPFGLDEESGLPHLWMLACNVAFLCDMYKDVFDIAVKREFKEDADAEN